MHVPCLTFVHVSARGAHVSQQTWSLSNAMHAAAASLLFPLSFNLGWIGSFPMLLRQATQQHTPYHLLHREAKHWHVACPADALRASPPAVMPPSCHSLTAPSHTLGACLSSCRWWCPASPLTALGGGSVGTLWPDSACSTGACCPSVLIHPWATQTAPSSNKRSLMWVWDGLGCWRGALGCVG
jgi:hypothetical protein